MQRARFYLAQLHVLVIAVSSITMDNRLQSAPHIGQIAEKIIICQKTAQTKKDARCANARVPCHWVYNRTNVYLCDINVFDVSHKSQEQRRFNQLNQPWIYISMEIHHYFHQFVRKPLMTEIIEAKADQVPAFAEALKNHKGCFLDLWPRQNCYHYTLSSAWSGSNKFGHIISNIASRMRCNTGRSHFASKMRQKTIHNLSQISRTLYYSNVN